MSQFYDKRTATPYTVPLGLNEREPLQYESDWPTARNYEIQQLVADHDFCDPAPAHDYVRRIMFRLEIYEADSPSIAEILASALDDFTYRRSYSLTDDSLYSSDGRSGSHQDRTELQDKRRRLYDSNVFPMITRRNMLQGHADYERLLANERYYVLGCKREVEDDQYHSEAATMPA
ncbi:hypothetical protein B0A48_15626 [Cryoendolithus antarcticus]|uniref:Uncharacterized protein n=1 Tax=Cryoendolithus antarcticus TaxID=1507870 RepID=A0A1V8SGZ1_9PEZI|nr:hypothetical protein B0A48_15626 [Cryoendolithus antarcticus]